LEEGKAKKPKTRTRGGDKCPNYNEVNCLKNTNREKRGIVTRGTGDARRLTLGESELKHHGTCEDKRKRKVNIGGRKKGEGGRAVGEGD